MAGHGLMKARHDCAMEDDLIQRLSETSDGVQLEEDELTLTDEIGSGENLGCSQLSLGHLIISNDDGHKNNDDGTSSRCIENVTSQENQGNLLFEVVDTIIMKEGRKQFVMYTVLLLRQGHTDSSMAKVQRRYSDFTQLYHDLLHIHPQLLRGVSLPKKRILGNFKPEIIAYRSRSFEKFLNQLCSLDSIRYSETFVNFFIGADLRNVYQCLIKNKFRDSISFLEKVTCLQQRLLGGSHESVICSLSALVAVLKTTEDYSRAQILAETALQRISNDNCVYLVPLIKMNIRLCWKLDMDKRDLEVRLELLQQKGINTDVPNLLKLVLQNLSKYS